MTKPAYSKPAMTLPDQLALLKSRGMAVADDARAMHYLGVINYYRLAAYWLPYEADHASHRFKPGTQFEDVLDDYGFDRELRLLINDAIERVEVALRTQIAYQLSLKYGPHFFLDMGLFKDPIRYVQMLGKLRSDIQSSKKVFIEHFRANYSDALPPAWAAVEIMTLGQLSKWFAAVAHSSDRNLVARYFDFDEVQLVSFLHHLAVIRNISAHHGRMWNREFRFTFKIPRHRPKALLNSMNPAAQKKIYNTLTVLAYFLDNISPNHHWREKLKALMDSAPAKQATMGFPANWKTLTIWTKN
ncbi:MAG: Abi family protein [Arenimonas sp.]|nr:Abi family protein [Arenimonas sp.]